MRQLIPYIILIFLSSCIGLKKGGSNTNSRELTAKQKERAEQHLLEGERHYLQEDNIKAYLNFQKALDINPNIGVAHYKCAEILSAKDDFKNAELKISKAIALEPMNRYYYELQIYIFKKQKKYKDAIKSYHKLIKEVKPNDADYLYELAGLQQYVTKDYKGALTTYEKLQEHYGFNPEIATQEMYIYQTLNRMSDYTATAEKLCKEYPDDLNFKTLLAETYYNTKRIEEAIIILTSLLSEHPKQGNSRLLLHEIYQRTGQDALAKEQLKYAFASPDIPIMNKIEYFHKYLNNGNDTNYVFDLCDSLLSIHPTDANAHMLKGDLYRSQDSLRQAQYHFHKSLSYEPDNAALWELVLNIDFVLDLPDSVITHAQQAIELYPNNPNNFFFYGLALSQVKEYSQATIILKEGIKLVYNKPTLKAEFYNHLGDAYNFMDEYIRSDSAYEQAILLDEKNYYAMNNYSYFLSLREEKLERAKELSFIVIQANPDNGTYLDTYAWILFKLKEYKEALIYIEATIEHTPKEWINGEVLEHYADILAANKQSEKALKYWKMAKELGDASDNIDTKIETGKLND